METINNFFKENYKKIIIIVIVVIFVSILNFFLETAEIRNIKSVKIGGQKIEVELALTDKEKEQGLSGRAMLASDQGMLFVFPRSDKYYFWMKEMNFPIDIIWLALSKGGDGNEAKVIYIKKDATPKSYPEAFGPDASAKYVLEVASGFSDKNNLKVGDSVLFN